MACVAYKFAVEVTKLVFNIFLRCYAGILREERELMNNPGSVSLLSGLRKPQIRF